MAEASTSGAAEASIRGSYPLHSVAGVRAKGSKPIKVHFLEREHYWSSQILTAQEFHQQRRSGVSRR
jgi:hypothetical protein